MGYGWVMDVLYNKVSQILVYVKFIMKIFMKITLDIRDFQVRLNKILVCQEKSGFIFSDAFRCVQI